MTGFVFRILCLNCLKSSPDYPLYVFSHSPEITLVLPAWSSRLRCYSVVRCYLSLEDQAALEKDVSKLHDFAATLTSAGLTVGVPMMSTVDGERQVTIEPPPTCPLCGGLAEVRHGYSVDEPVLKAADFSDPYVVPLDRLGLSIRAENCLTSEGIGSLGELCERTADELLAIRNFGNSTLLEVQAKLEAAGLKLRQA